MNPLDLMCGDWCAFDYNGKPRLGRIEEKKFGANPTCSKIINGVRRFSMQTGWLLNTEDGYRHFRLNKMDNVRIICKPRESRIE